MDQSEREARLKALLSESFERGFRQCAALGVERLEDLLEVVKANPYSAKEGVPKAVGEHGQFITEHILTRVIGIITELQEMEIVTTVINMGDSSDAN
jgi:hypothetical protein